MVGKSWRAVGRGDARGEQNDAVNCLHPPSSPVARRKSSKLRRSPRDPRSPSLTCLQDSP